MKWFNRIQYTVLDIVYVIQVYILYYKLYMLLGYILYYIQYMLLSYIYTVYVILLFQDKTLSYSSLQPKHFQRSNKTDPRGIFQLKTYNLMENVTMENVTI